MNILFLDLESTIIEPVLDGWFRTELINIDKINQFIKDKNITEVNIFSFAIHNDYELSGFNRGTKEMIERAIGISLNIIPRVDNEIKKACCSINQLSPERVDFQDMCDFWGKQTAFRLFIRNLFLMNTEEKNIFFLDDDVFNESTQWKDLNINFEILNIDQF